jgi:uncharacterized membrane protein
MSKDNSILKLFIFTLISIFIIPYSFSSVDFNAYASTGEINTCACSTYENHIYLQNLDSNNKYITYSVDSNLNETMQVTDLYTEFYVSQEYINQKSTFFPNFFVLKSGETQLVTNFIQIPCDASQNYEIKTFLGTKKNQKVLTQEIKPIKCKSLEVLVYNQSLSACANDIYAYKFKVENPSTFSENYKVTIDSPIEFKDLVSANLDNFILEKGGFVDIFIYIQTMDNFGEFPFNVKVESIKNGLKSEFSFDLEIIPCYGFDLFFGEMLDYTSNSSQIDFFNYNKTSYSVCESEKTIIPLKVLNNNNKNLDLDFNLEPSDSFLSVWYSELFNITKNTHANNYVNLAPSEYDIDEHNFSLFIAPPNSKVYNKYPFKVNVIRCNTPKLSFPDISLDFENPNYIYFNLSNNGLFESFYTLNLDLNKNGQNNSITSLILRGDLIDYETLININVSEYDSNLTIKSNDVLRLSPNETKSLILYLDNLDPSETLNLDVQVISIDNGNVYSNNLVLNERKWFGLSNILIKILQIILLVLIFILLIILIIKFIIPFFRNKKKESKKRKIKSKKEEDNLTVVNQLFNVEETSSTSSKSYNFPIEEEKTQTKKSKISETYKKQKRIKKTDDWLRLVLILFGVLILVLFLISVIVVLFSYIDFNKTDEGKSLNNSTIITNDSDILNQTNQSIQSDQSENITIINQDNQTNETNFTNQENQTTAFEDTNNQPSETNNKEKTNFFSSFINYLKNLFSRDSEELETKTNKSQLENNTIDTNNTDSSLVADNLTTENTSQNATEEIDYANCELNWSSGDSIKINLSKAFISDDSKTFIYSVVNEPSFISYEFDDDIVTLTAPDDFKGMDSISFQADDMMDKPILSPSLTLCIEEEEKSNIFSRIYNSTKNFIYTYRYNILFAFIVLILVIIILNYIDEKKEKSGNKDSSPKKKIKSNKVTPIKSKKKATKKSKKKSKKKAKPKTKKKAN